MSEIENRKLKVSRRLFIDVLLGEAGGNASEAARMAGYSGAQPAKTGMRLLRDPAVRAEIDRRLEASALSAAEVLDGLSRIARGDYGDLEACYRVEGGRRVLDLGEVRRRGLGALIESVTPTKFGDSVKLHSRLRALELLAKHHGLLIDRHAVSIDLDLSTLDDDQLARIAAGQPLSQANPANTRLLGANVHNQAQQGEDSVKALPGPG